MRLSRLSKSKNARFSRKHEACNAHWVKVSKTLGADRRIYGVRGLRQGAPY